MRKPLFHLVKYSFPLLSLLYLLSTAKPPPPLGSQDLLRDAAFRILETKCNSCHRKRNPFMVFREKNIDKRAPRIYQAVFVQRSMPKANGIPLTPAESDTLQQWLKTKLN